MPRHGTQAMLLQVQLDAEQVECVSVGFEPYSNVGILHFLSVVIVVVE